MSRQRVPNNMLLDLVETSSFRATGAAANFPASGSGEEFYVAPSQKSTIQCYNRSTATWLDLVANTRNVFINQANPSGVLQFGAASTPPVMRQSGSGSLTVESSNQYLMLHSKGTTHAGGNTYWDATNWRPYDAAQTAMMFSVNLGSINFYSAAAGNPTPLVALQNIQSSTGLWTNDTWHTVAYQSGFSAQSGWNDVQYTRTPEGMVRFRGLLMSPASGWAYNVPAFTLPVGYRLTLEPGAGYPANQGANGYHFFWTISDGALANPFGMIYIWADGRFCPNMASAGATAGVHWWDMSGIAYMAAA